MHEWIAGEHLDQMMAEPDGAEAIRRARQGIRDGRWGSDYTDAIGQGPFSSWPMEQLAMFAQVHAGIYGGTIATTRIRTAGPPGRDAEREQNAQTLARLPRPFTAAVDRYQGNQGGDGTLRWDEPITVELATGLIDRHADGTTRPLLVSYQFPPGRATLEIGQSLASRTWQHLLMESYIARWPYGQSRIWLFLNLGRHPLDEAMGTHC